MYHNAKVHWFYSFLLEMMCVSVHVPFFVTVIDRINLFSDYSGLDYCAIVVHSIHICMFPSSYCTKHNSKSSLLTFHTQSCGWNAFQWMFFLIRAIKSGKNSHLHLVFQKFPKVAPNFTKSHSWHILFIAEINFKISSNRKDCTLLIHSWSPRYISLLVLSGLPKPTGGCK